MGNVEQVNAFEEGLLLGNGTSIPTHRTSIPHHFTFIPTHYTSVPVEVRHVTTQTLPREVQYNLHYIS